MHSYHSSDNQYHWKAWNRFTRDVQISSQRPHSTPAALGISSEETMEAYSEYRSLMASKWAIKSPETEPQVFGNQAFGLSITCAEQSKTEDYASDTNSVGETSDDDISTAYEGPKDFEIDWCSVQSAAPKTQLADNSNNSQSGMRRLGSKYSLSKLPKNQPLENKLIVQYTRDDLLAINMSINTAWICSDTIESLNEALKRLTLCSDYE